MLDALLNYLFGCSHSRITFPLTPIQKFGNDVSNRRNMYVVCLKCGAEFAYDWERMRIAMPIPTYSLLSQPLNWSALKARGDEIG